MEIKTKIAIVGCGNISDIHIKNRLAFGLDVVACTDMERLITSFDVWATNLPRIEVYDSAGSLSVPDPNTFGGPVQVKSAKDEEWQNVPLTHGHTENSRGLGVSDMVVAIRENRQHCANGEMAFHSLDLMQSFEEPERSKYMETL